MTFRTIRFAASFAVLTATSFAQGTLFPNTFWYAADDAPYGGTLADINGDGNLDYLVADYYTNKVSVYLGTGTGGLTPLPAIIVGNTPRTVIVADMDGDTKPDLISVNSSDDTVSVLLGDGLGGFGAPTSFTTTAGTFPAWIDAGDLNNDGKLDIVAGNGSTDDLSVLLGNGTGGLSAPIHQYVGFTPERIKLVDMNNDGKLDCVTASWLDDRVCVNLGDGNGNLFLTTSVFSQTPKGLAVGDTNADGNADVVVSSSQSPHVQIFAGIGTGGLATPKSFYLGSGANYSTAVMLADVSGDGRADLISCEASSKTLTVLVNAGAGDFGLALSSPIPESAYDAVAADLNGDGFAEVVTANLTDDSIRVHLCAGVGSWEHYCTAKTNSLGCVPTIRASGTPSVSNARPFWVYVSQVYDNKPGIFIYTVNGAKAAIPFQGGTLCIGSTGIRRGPAMNSGTNPKYTSPNCEGTYALNFNAFAQGLAGGNPDPGLLILGNTCQVQAWSRDPGFTAPNNSGLSPALDITLWL